MNTNTTYQEVTKAVSQAVDADNKTKGKWQIAAQAVAGFYKTADMLEAVEAQFTADAILPSLPKHAAALAVDLPRKNSEEYKKLGEANRNKWEEADKAKKAARSTCKTYFARIVSYAFPKEKVETEPQSIEVKFNKVLSDLIGKCEKAETAPFDLVAVKAALVKAQKLVNKSAE